jgi:hypothetical protein
MRDLASPEKLRSTCNQCALSKVRCNKRKPTCQRCETQKHECVYDRSRRRGKPRSSRQQRSFDRRSTRYSAQSSYNNVEIDPFSKLSSLLPGDDIFDCSHWADSNMFCGDKFHATRPGTAATAADGRLFCSHKICTVRQTLPRRNMHKHRVLHTRHALVILLKLPL